MQELVILDNFLKNDEISSNNTLQFQFCEHCGVNSLLCQQSKLIEQQQLLLKHYIANHEGQTTNIFQRHKRKIIMGCILVLLVTTAAIVACQLTKSGVEIEKDTQEPPQENLGEDKDIQIIPRNAWGARPPKNTTKFLKTPSLVVIKHTAGGTCSDTPSCMSKMQSLQSYLVGQRGAPDIWYNFLIAGDGNVYQCRGWDVQNDFRDDSIDIGFVGNYVYDQLTPKMVEAGKALIQRGLEMRKLTSDYRLVNHNQTVPSDSPGPNVVKEVKKWPHYYSGLLFS